MKGVYALIIDINKKMKVMVGKIGQLFFDKGIYVYFGSALGDGASSIEGRIRPLKNKINIKIVFLEKCIFFNPNICIYNC